MARKRAKKNGSPGKSAGGALVHDSILPMLTTFPVIRSGHLRYRCAGSATTSISGAKLAGLYVSGIAAATSVVALIGAIKIKRIRMIDNGGSPIFLQWLGQNALGATAELQAVGMSGATPSVIDSQPPTGSAAAFWQGLLASGSTTAVFTLTGNPVTSGIGTYVDVWFDWVMSQSAFTATVQSALSATGVYTLPLDGVGVSPAYPSESSNATN